MKMIKKTVALSLGLVMLGGVASFAQSLADAKKAIDAEQYQKATSMLKTLINSQAKNGDNYFNLGNIYLTLDEPDSARAIFSNGVAADPKNALNYVGLGHVDVYVNNAAAAKANFDKAVELGKKNYQTYLNIGMAYFQSPKPDYAAALPFLEKADELETKDKDPEVFIAMGDYWADQRDNGKAYERYRRALDIDPDIKRVKVQLGRMFSMAEGYPEAEDKIKEVIETDPNYGPAYREMAENQLRWSFKDQSAKAKRIEALASMKKYLDLTDKSFDSRFRYVQFLAYAEDWAGLTSELATLKADPANPKSFVIDRLQGYAAAQNQNYTKAIQSLTKLFNDKANASRIISSDYMFLGKAYQQEGNIDLAITNLKKGIELDSTKADTLALYGQKLFGEKKYDKAILALKAAIDLNSKNPAMAFNSHYLGMANFWQYATLNNEKQNPSPELLKSADTAFARVVELKPDYDPALWYRVRINKLLDDPQNPTGAAIPFYEKYIEMVTVTYPEKATAKGIITNLIDAYNNLASFYSANDKDKAIGYLNKTLALDPQNAYAQEALKVLNGASAQPKKAPIK